MEVVVEEQSTRHFLSYASLLEFACGAVCVGWGVPDFINARERRMYPANWAVVPEVVDDERERRAA